MMFIIYEILHFVTVKEWLYLNMWNKFIMNILLLFQIL